MTDALENQIDLWMKQFAAIDDRERLLPDPSVIWLKARVLQSAKAVERASRPITMMQIASYGIVGACWAALLTWKWIALQSWLDSMRPSQIVLAQGSPLSVSFVLTFLVLGAVTVMVAMQSIFAEE
jgi:hypothetical protein